MARTLPRLRADIDATPSPVPDRPGVMLRDPLNCTSRVLILPPPLVACLGLFDGVSTDLDLRAHLVRVTGSILVGDTVEGLIEELSQAGFLQDERYDAIRREREIEFARSPAREPLHAGSAYPLEPDAIRAMLEPTPSQEAPEKPPGELIGIAAPHVSPAGGLGSFQAAYHVLGPELADRVFVILGTSHHGEPDRFGLTRKPYRTPLGEARTEASLAERLAEAAPGAVRMEDYCHAVEHSIEFQVLFLQARLGPGIAILPVLCGAMTGGLVEGSLPEENPAIGAFLPALHEMAVAEGNRLFWVLGIDLAHQGRRYGDPFPARAAEGRMRFVEERDRARLDRIAEGDPEGFWALVREGGDDLHWCGSSPLYAFLRALPGVRGRLLRYEQWNIDPESVVSFAGIAFTH